MRFEIAEFGEVFVLFAFYCRWNSATHLPPDSVEKNEKCINGFQVLLFNSNFFYLFLRLLCFAVQTWSFATRNGCIIFLDDQFSGWEYIGSVFLLFKISNDWKGSEGGISFHGVTHFYTFWCDFNGKLSGICNGIWRHFPETRMAIFMRVAFILCSFMKHVSILWKY